MIDNLKPAWNRYFINCYMRALKHFVGVMGIAITLDYFLFNGYCTNVSGELFSQAYIQILSELGKSFRGFL